jgi:hypothetical protein
MTSPTGRSQLLVVTLRRAKSSSMSKLQDICCFAFLGGSHSGRR